MKMTFVAIAAAATLAGSLATTPASAQRGLGAAVAGGLIGGAIVGGLAGKGIAEAIDPTREDATGGGRLR